jgi:hypothetical protein
MRGIRAVLIAVIVLGVAGAAGATGPRTLTRAGDLYAVAVVDNQAVVTARHADGTVSELLVPQSASAVEASLQVGFHETTGALFVVWQRLTGMDAKIRLAAYVDGTWIGPRTVAGNDGTAAHSPQLLVQRATSEVTEASDPDGEPVTTTFETSFAHVLWWSQVSEEDAGLAMLASYPLDPDGLPLYDEPRVASLNDLLPYGAVCHEIAAVDSLRHPKIFIDPQSGNPHVFLTDFEACAFQIMELLPAVVEDDAEGKRRRQIIILRHARTVTIRPDLRLDEAKFAVGRHLAIVAYWDGAHSDIEYVWMDGSESTGTKTLALGENLSHEQAVELIRELAN